MDPTFLRQWAGSSSLYPPNQGHRALINDSECMNGVETFRRALSSKVPFRETGIVSKERENKKIRKILRS